MFGCLLTVLFSEGCVELIDVAGARVVETIVCHEGAIWDIQITPDKKGIATASADKVVFL
jgi:hypothetical protein